MVVKEAKMARETILIIEDDSDLREGLHFSFAGDGYDVLDAGTKRQGLYEIKKAHVIWFC